MIAHVDYRKFSRVFLFARKGDMRQDCDTICLRMQPVRLFLRALTGGLDI